MIAAVVPAAGAGTRMGRPKLTLPVGGRPVIERVVTALREGGADPVLVVTGPHDPAVGPLARAAGAEVCDLPVLTPDMRATVEHGLLWLAENRHPKVDDAWLLAPADFPLLDAAVVRQLCEAYGKGPAGSILVPTYARRRGHPVLIGWKHVAAIAALPPGVGVNAYLRDRAETTEVPVEGDGGILDLDTPEDYEAVR